MIQSCALLACNAALMPADLDFFLLDGLFLVKNGFSASLERKVLDCDAGLCILMPAFTCVHSYVLLCLLLALLLEGGDQPGEFLDLPQSSLTLWVPRPFSMTCATPIRHSGINLTWQ